MYVCVCVFVFVCDMSVYVCAFMCGVYVCMCVYDYMCVCTHACTPCIRMLRPEEDVGPLAFSVPTLFL